MAREDTGPHTRPQGEAQSGHRSHSHLPYRIGGTGIQRTSATCLHWGGEMRQSGHMLGPLHTGLPQHLEA